MSLSIPLLSNLVSYSVLRHSISLRNVDHNIMQHTTEEIGAVVDKDMGSIDTRPVAHN